MVRILIDGEIKLKILRDTVELLVGELVVKVRQKEDKLHYDIETYHIVMPDQKRRFSL